VRELLGHERIETTQVYAQIRPEQLKRAVSFYETRAQEATRSVFEELLDVPQTRERRTSAKTTWWPQEATTAWSAIELRGFLPRAA
jgi:hypothetical protein